MAVGVKELARKPIIRSVLSGEAARHRHVVCWHFRRWLVGEGGAAGTLLPSRLAGLIDQPADPLRYVRGAAREDGPSLAEVERKVRCYI